MMVQGHTIKALIDPEVLQSGSGGWTQWTYVRGFTAPMFLFIAGTVFAFLLFRGERQRPNPRIRKGLIRAMVLLVLGYWLNSTSFYLDIFYTQPVGYSRVLWRADVLHCIGVGLLVLLGSFWIFRRTSRGFQVSIAAFTVSLLALHAVRKDAPLSQELPLWFAQYWTGGEGSLFPLVPWAAYMLMGALLGSGLNRLAKDGLRRPRLAFVLAGIGLGLLAAAYLGERLEMAWLGRTSFWTYSPCLVLFRTGWVLLVCSALALLGRFGDLPLFWRQVSRNSLWIYVGHLKVLDWVRAAGVQALEPTVAMAAAVGMLFLMGIWTKLLVWLGNRTGIRL